MCVNERKIEQFFFIARISTRLRFMSFPHERTQDKYFFSTREYPRDGGLCHFRMNEREINIFFQLAREQLRIFGQYGGENFHKFLQNGKEGSQSLAPLQLIMRGDCVSKTLAGLSRLRRLSPPCSCQRRRRSRTSP